MTFNEKKEKVSKISKSISIDDMATAAAATMADDKFDMLIRNQPHILLLLTTFSASLTHRLFDDVWPKEMDKEESDDKT